MEESDKQRKTSEGMARRLANLKRFQPGQSGNPKGRPKTITLSEMLRRQLAKTLPGESERTYLEEISRMLCEVAVQGSIAACREIFDRTEGKPRQSIDVGVDAGGDGAQLVVIQMPDNGRNDRTNILHEEGVESLALPAFDDVDEVESDVE